MHLNLSNRDEVSTADDTHVLTFACVLEGSCDVLVQLVSHTTRGGGGCVLRVCVHLGE